MIHQTFMGRFRGLRGILEGILELFFKSLWGIFLWIEKVSVLAYGCGPVLR